MNFESLFEVIAEKTKENYPYYEKITTLPVYETIKAFDAEQKRDFILFLLAEARAGVAKRVPGQVYSSYREGRAFDCIFILLRSKTKLRDEDFLLLFKEACVGWGLHFCHFGVLVSRIEEHLKRHGLSEPLSRDLERIISDKEFSRNEYYEAKTIKALKKLKGLVEREAGGKQALPFQFGEGCFSRMLADDFGKIDVTNQEKWNNMFHYFDTARAGKPGKNWLKGADVHISLIGKASFKKQMLIWLERASQSDIEETIHDVAHNGKVIYQYSEYKYLGDHNTDFLKGMIWSMYRFYDNRYLLILARLAENCYKKIPGKGAAAAAVGNAAIFTLFQSKGLEGISHLSGLKLRIRQNNTQKLIEGYIEQKAEKLGLKPAQIEEIAVPDFDLSHGSTNINFQTGQMKDWLQGKGSVHLKGVPIDGKLNQPVDFSSYTLFLKLSGIGKTEMKWVRLNGTEQKSVPAFIKNSKPLMARLKKMRDKAKEMKKASITQRDRIDRLYVDDMRWNGEDFEKYYLHHGLVSYIAQKLIWNLDGVPALYYDDQWEDVTSQKIEPAEDVTYTMWHPIESTTDEVLAWRDRLEELGLQQPFKQAWREIYPLTEAEINTATYSNRMAAHFLKQHQFNSLAALRGWKYSLLGSYDDGKNGEIASKALPSCKLEAQFWVDEIHDDNESCNDAGIWHYVATDQVRFNDEAGEAVPLIDVPKLIFSEVMRDVDLFVGVASVANDPTWQDGGPNERPEYRDYWQTYSFGDLNEMAKTRKSVLERLLPRLKIKDVAHIDGKFLMVDGKRHTYKIHIGSGNILIAPHDKYLCIVPGRGKDKNLSKIFLPFEGDSGLSIVLSKAFMLAEDDKITDQTILSQL